MVSGASLWLDTKKPDAGLTPRDTTVTGVFVEDTGLGVARVQIPHDGPENIVNVPSTPGVYAKGALVLVTLSTRGVPLGMTPPNRLPPGSTPVGVGEWGEHALTNPTRDELDAATAELEEAMGGLDGRLTDAAGRLDNLGSGLNLIPNGAGELGSNVGWPQVLTWDITDMPAGLTGSLRSAPGAGTASQGGAFFDVQPSTEYLAEIWVKADKANSRLYVELRDQAGAHGATTTTADGSPSTGSSPYLLGNVVAPTVWTKYTAVVKTNASTARLRIGSIYFNHAAGTERTATVWLAGARMRPRVEASLLVDGGVLARHLTVTEEMWARLATFAKVTTDMLLAGSAKITGDLLAETIRLSTQIVAGNPLGTHAKMDGTGFRVMRDSVNGPVEVIRLGVAATDDYLGIVDAAGALLASINDEGRAVFQGIDAGQSLTYRGQELATVLDSRARGLVGWGGGWPWAGQPNHAISGEESLFDLTVDLVAGRMYQLDGAFGWTSTNDSAAVELRVRVTSSATGTPASPNASTPLYTMLRFSGLKNGQTRTETTSGTLFTTNVTGRHRFLFSIAEAFVAGGVILSYATAVPRLSVIDIGPALPQMTNPNQVIAPAPVTPPPAVQRYIKDYPQTWHQNYTIGLGQDTGPLSAYAVQGPSGGTPRMSLLGFASMTADLSGATINAMFVYLYFQHWYNNAGGTASIGVHGASTKPATYADNGRVVESGGWPKPGGRWVELPAHVWNGFRTGQYRGISLRAPSDSTNKTYYGYVIPGQSMIRVDFTK